MKRVLDYDQAPAISVPLRFLLAAPVLALPAAALLLYYGPALLATRWSAAALAATHLITLGFIAHSVVGALLQFLPVAAGADIRKLHRAAPWLQALLTAGTLLLVGVGYLAVYDLARPGQPEHLANLETGTMPRDFAVLPGGHQVLVAGGLGHPDSGEVARVDLADPRKPALMATWSGSEAGQPTVAAGAAVNIGTFLNDDAFEMPPGTKYRARPSRATC